MMMWNESYLYANAKTCWFYLITIAMDEPVKYERRNYSFRIRMKYLSTDRNYNAVQRQFA